VDVGTINSTLNLGTSVTIDTVNSGAAGGAAGNLTVSSPSPRPQAAMQRLPSMLRVT